MATQISTIESLARLRMVAATGGSNPDTFWSSQEFTDIIIAGIKDLWRPIVDLKAEHFSTLNTTDVSQPANATQLQGVPADVWKIINIEPKDVSPNSATQGLIYKPLDYWHRFFRSARAQDPIDPTDSIIYYDIAGAGAPIAAPTIYVAPQVNSAIALAFMYVPTLPQMNTNSFIPIPGEADNALVSWAVAFARAKERDDRSPDPAWLEVYSTEKQNLLESLGLRQYQEPLFTDAVFEEYWG